MSRPVTQAPSEFFAVRISVELAKACKSEWERRGISKRTLFERAIRVELGLPVTAQTVQPDPELLAIPLIQFTKGVGKPSGCDISTTLIEDMRLVVEHTEGLTKRSFFEHALLVELGLLPTKKTTTTTESATRSPGGDGTQETRDFTATTRKSATKEEAA